MSSGLGNSDSNYGPAIHRRVEAPGLHPPQERHLIGWVPSPGLPIPVGKDFPSPVGQLVWSLATH